MVGLIMTIAIAWLISFSIGTMLLAIYENKQQDWEIHPLRLLVLLIPIINTVYTIYIIYKLIGIDNINSLKL